MSFRNLVVVCSFFLIPVGSAFAQSSDLFVTKDAPSVVSAGSDFTYTITIDNTGPDASDVVNLVDNIPAGLTFVSLTQSGPDTFTCSTPSVGTNGQVSCNTATMASGDIHSLFLTVNIPPDAAAGTVYTNIANISSTFDPNDENNSGVAVTSTPLPPQADVAITKSGPASAAANTDVTYTITLTNLGPDDASAVSWSDTLPQGTPPSAMTFVSFNRTSGPAFNCGSPSTSVTCTLATMSAGATATFQYVGHIPNGTPSGTVYTNVASQSTSNDTNSENDSSGTVLTVSSANVGVTKSAPASGNAGGTIDYVITLSNGGPDTAINALFSDTLASSVTFVSAVQNTGPAGSCSPPPQGPGGTYTPGGTVTCGVALLGNGASAQFTITVAISPSTPNGTVITNTATASSDSADSDSSNNSSTASTNISTVADLSITKSGPATLVAGANMTYTINVANAGPSDVTNATITDNFPSGISLVSLSQSSGPAFNCSTAPTGITCTTPSFPSGASASLSVNVMTSSGLDNGHTLSNIATFFGSGAPDPNNGNNSAMASTTFTTSADVSITKSAGAAVNAGANLSYTINVANAGISDATAVSFTDILPASTTFVSLTQNTGPAFSCTTGATINCSIASLISGSSASFTLVVQVSNATPNNTTISNTATVTSTTSDPNPANNSATAPTTVSNNADLIVTKSGPGTPTAIGFDITYTISLHNNGPNDAASTSLTDVLPPNTTFGSFSQTSGPAFSCATPPANGTGTITCTIASLANGATATFMLVMHQSATAGTTVTNTATAAATTPDPNPANNTGSASVTVLAQIPALSPAMLLLLAMSLAIGASVALRR